MGPAQQPAGGGPAVGDGVGDGWVYRCSDGATAGSSTTGS
jgi:hypothetical protein